MCGHHAGAKRLETTSKICASSSASPANSSSGRCRSRTSYPYEFCSLCCDRSSSTGLTSDRSTFETAGVFVTNDPIASRPSATPRRVLAGNQPHHLQPHRSEQGIKASSLDYMISVAIKRRGTILSHLLLYDISHVG